MERVIDELYPSNGKIGPEAPFGDISPNDQKGSAKKRGAGTQ